MSALNHSTYLITSELLDHLGVLCQSLASLSPSLLTTPPPFFFFRGWSFWFSFPSTARQNRQWKSAFLREAKFLQERFVFKVCQTHSEARVKFFCTTSQKNLTYLCFCISNRFYHPSDLYITIYWFSPLDRLNSKHLLLQTWQIPSTLPSISKILASCCYNPSSQIAELLPLQWQLRYLKCWAHKTTFWMPTSTNTPLLAGNTAAKAPSKAFKFTVALLLLIPLKAEQGCKSLIVKWECVK